MADIENCMILQSATQDVTIVPKDVAAFTETWKGPWAEIKKLTKESKVLGVVLIVGMKRPTFNENWQEVVSVPEPLSTDKPWVIRTLNIRQNVGNSGFLTITYEAGTPQWDGDGTYPEEQEKDAENYEILKSKTWNISWQAFNRSVLEYSNIPDEQIKLREMPATEAWTFYQNVATGTVAQFPDNDKEKSIQLYYSRNISPQFHYPVITLHQEYEMPENTNWFTDFGKSIDKIVNLPNECPFTSLQGWEWLMIADTGTMRTSNSINVENVEGEQPVVKTQTTYIYSRDTVWQGAKKWDPNFYGQNAWQPVED